MLQHECVGPDLGKSCLSCVQLLTKVSYLFVILHILLNTVLILCHLLFDSLSMLSLLLCVLFCVEVTGGDMPHINMAPLALPAHLAMEEFAEKTSVIKVWSLYYCSFQLCPYTHYCSKVYRISKMC